MSEPIARSQEETVATRTEGTSSSRWALAALSVSMLLSSLGTSVMNVALPTLAQVFAVSFQSVQWIVLAYLVALTALIVSAGRLGDIAGRRRLLLVGILVFTTASILAGVAPTFWLLVLARAAQGLGAAMMMALTIAFVGEAVPKARTGRAMGLLGTMSAIGTALGPSLGGVLLAALGWRAIFFAKALLGVLALLLVYRCLPGDHKGPQEKQAGVDSVGTLLLGLSLSAYALGMTAGGARFGPLNVALLVAAALGAGLFVIAEARTSSPLVELTMFRMPGFGAGLATSLLVSTVLMATLVVGPFYLSRTLDLGAGRVGLVMSVGPLVAALAGLPAGRLVDRVGAPFTAVVGLVGIAAGSAALSVMPATFGVAGYVATVVLITTNYALFQAANNAAVMTGIYPGQRGVASGLLSLSRNLGLITGASLMGAVFSFASGATEIATTRPEAVAIGMRSTFGIATVLILAALAIATGSRVGRRIVPGSGTGTLTQTPA